MATNTNTAKRTVYNLLRAWRQEGRSAFALLLDPDRVSEEQLPTTMDQALEAGVDLFLIGSSILLGDSFPRFVRQVKSLAGGHPVVLFPGSEYQVSSHADALLFLSLLSGRNADFLIGKQVLAAPLVWRSGLETISCAYLLIESGRLTSAQFASHTLPIPRDKPEIVLAHALAACFLGFQSIYLEAGSGADHPVPETTIQQVAKAVDLPLFVGGGIRTPEQAAARAQAGASVVVIGNYFEKTNHRSRLKAFARAIHQE